jgi:carboxyl-terminal processing protease
MSDWYFWAGASPNPDPSGYLDVPGYFDALRFTGNGVVPADRWSYIEDSAAYNQFFGDGKSMGFGLWFNTSADGQLLKIGYIEPQSPGAGAGLKRGDVVVSVNGRSFAQLQAANDFSALVPGVPGQSVTLEIQNGATTRFVTLVAATYDLVPVTANKVLTLPDGTRAGYVSLKDFVPVAEAPLNTAFATFRAAGATEIIIDLRYDGGGRLSTSALLASLVAGGSNGGKVFVSTRANAAHPSANDVFNLSSVPGANFSRAVVLTSRRTCSASELVINGLKPYMNVVTIGGATCGKPFGFSPVQSCGKVFSAVNFESFNALGEGRYYSGIQPTCPVVDDIAGELGDPAEKLTAAAMSYLQTGACPAQTMSAQSLGSQARRMLQIGPNQREGVVID